MFGRRHSIVCNTMCMPGQTGRTGSPLIQIQTQHGARLPLVITARPALSMFDRFQGAGRFKT